jgi:hypothetical protein
MGNLDLHLIRNQKIFLVDLDNVYDFMGKYD